MPSLSRICIAPSIQFCPHIYGTKSYTSNLGRHLNFAGPWESFRGNYRVHCVGLHPIGTVPVGSGILLL